MPPYSLLQRFQGANLGAMVGLWYGLGDVAHCDDPAFPAAVGQLQAVVDRLLNPGLGPNMAAIAGFGAGFGAGANFGADSALGAAPVMVQALYLLPLWLYRHESWRQRQAGLSDLVPSLDAVENQADRAGLWLFGEVIAQVLHRQGQLSVLPDRLLQQWTKHAQQGAPDCPIDWERSLATLQAARSRSLGWAQLRPLWQTLPDSHQGLVISIYAFLQSPQDYQLAIQTAIYLQQQLGPPSIGQPSIGQPSIGQRQDVAIVAALTGALWGAYNGWAGLPVAWLGRFDRSTAQFAPIQAMAAALLQSWSGTLGGDQRSEELPTVMAAR
jgi:hypothetical protein